MATSEPAILILANDPAAARRWAEALRKVTSCVWLEAADVPAETHIDVILTDRPLEASPGADHPLLLAGEVGVVTVGLGSPAGLADQTVVSLPAAATDRELRLACQLLAQIVRLLGERRQGERQHSILALQALTDPLTGLPNRRAWEQELQALLESAKIGQSLCLAMFDVDCFKRVNDVRGYVVGDDVLRAAAQGLLGLVRRGDFVARLGGDEFGALLADVSSADAAAIVERVRGGLTAPLTSSATMSVTASAGYCVAEQVDLKDATALLTAADRALRAAKHAGRDRTVGAADV